MFIAGLILILSNPVGAIDIIPPVYAQQETLKGESQKQTKETKVSITGIVREISDTTIIVERTLKGKTETTEFILEKPVEKIKVGDKVRVSYVRRGGKNTAIKVIPFTPKTIVKKPQPTKDVKPARVEGKPSNP